MEPEVHYVTTDDGVRIAYTVSGDGPPVVVCWDAIASHVQLEWSHPLIKVLFGELTRSNTVIRFDTRGCGLSDRVLPQTLDELVLDIEAVVQRTGFREFALMGFQFGSPPAIAFAARHADQVSRLVLFDGYARVGDMFNTPQVQAMFAAAKADWIMATESMGFAAFGAAREESLPHGAYIRSCVGPEFFEHQEVLATFDASELARSVTAPTLVLKHTGVQYVTMEMVKDIAARIPNAQLVVVEGAWADDPEGVMHRGIAFINAGIVQATPSPDLPSGTAIILFADIVDSTALTERMGDTVFRAKARELDGALRSAIRENAGTAVEGKLLGDGVLAVFTSARQAIEAALACGRSGDDAGFPLHLGLHAGDVIREENNVYGGAVNIAARISGLSAPGEVLVSDTVRSLARTSAGVQFEDRGEQALKGIDEPVRVWAVRKGEG
jgi:class 3 adenylate cyclase